MQAGPRKAFNEVSVSHKNLLMRQSLAATLSALAELRPGQERDLLGALVKSSQYLKFAGGPPQRKKQNFPPPELSGAYIAQLRQGIVDVKAAYPVHLAHWKIMCTILPFAKQYTRRSLVQELGVTGWMVHTTRAHIDQYGVMPGDHPAERTKRLRRSMAAKREASLAECALYHGLGC